ncbi:MAG: hypothetical protein HY436_00600 [Candidatus Liptonbacteria bacterium]|nr:hypothetical protein [Candidatus Liptonbacteria bacterium]
MRISGLRTGLTLIELLIFAAIFLVISVVFVAILITITRVYVRQSAVAEVNQQSHFLLQTIQRHVEESSVLDNDAMPAGAAVPELRLYVPAAPEYVRIYIDANDPPDGIADPEGVVYRDKVDTITNAVVSRDSLTTDAVKVSALSFTRYENAPGHDSVNMNFMMEFSTAKPQQQFSQFLTFGVARVGAATFDSSVLPNQTSQLQLGNSSRRWTNINDLLYFHSSGNNVGINTNSPNAQLEVKGTLILNGAGIGTQPTCSETNSQIGEIRGMVWITWSAPGVADALQVCAKAADDTYSWRALY